MFPDLQVVVFAMFIRHVPHQNLSTAPALLSYIATFRLLSLRIG